VARRVSGGISSQVRADPWLVSGRLCVRQDVTNREPGFLAWRWIQRNRPLFQYQHQQERNASMKKLNPHNAWVNEGLNRVDFQEAKKLAQEIANRENRNVEVAVDNHGGYPQHYFIIPKGGKHRSFSFHAADIAPDHEIETCCVCDGTTTPPRHEAGCPSVVDKADTITDCADCGLSHVNSEPGCCYGCGSKNVFSRLLETENYNDAPPEDWAGWE
jgi:hypothetical protein